MLLWCSIASIGGSHNSAVKVESRCLGSPRGHWRMRRELHHGEEDGELEVRML